MNKHFLILLLSVSFSQFVWGAKIDTVFLHNGDQITGEVKIMENNLLELSTDNAGKIKIEWDKIDSVYVKQRIRIEHSDGSVLFGTLKPSGISKKAILIRDDLTEILLSHDNIATITPDAIEFLTRIDGKISSGFSYTKASDLGRFNFAGNLIYRHNLNQAEIDYSVLTEREGEKRNERQNGGLRYIRLLPNKLFLLNRLFAESNSELGLQLRTNYVLGLGKTLIYSRHTELHLIGGLNTNRETRTDTSVYNLEGALSLKFSVFKYSSPKLSIDFKGIVYPSLNNWGRVRTYVESSLSWEVFEDFYFKWSFYHEFDNLPIDSEGPLTDWAIGLLGIEYQF